MKLLTRGLLMTSCRWVTREMVDSTNNGTTISPRTMASGGGAMNW